ncbi:MAG: N-acetylneuraminate synthase family protein [Planctomycetota bacterium]|jgi:sialic acid synthase SpsE
MFIIAEIGINHMGSVVIAEKLIEDAWENGASAVKFQLYDPGYVFKDGPEMDEADRCALSREEYMALFDYARYEVGIECFASVFDEDRLDWAEKWEVAYHKLANRTVCEDPALCHKVLSIGKPTFVSISKGCVQHNLLDYNNAIFLKCVPEYPARAKDYDFDPAPFKTRGISDHTIGLDMGMHAVLSGHDYFEKHFTLNKGLAGPDHICSMTPDELFHLAHPPFAKERL